MLFGWVWMDPVMGLVGSIVITRWSIGLLKETSRVLLDWTGDSGLTRRIRELFERAGAVEVTDLHLWEVGPARYAAIVSLQTNDSKPAEEHKSMLKDFTTLVHVTIEVNRP